MGIFIFQIFSPSPCHCPHQFNTKELIMIKFNFNYLFKLKNDNWQSKIFMAKNYQQQQQQNDHYQDS